MFSFMGQQSDQSIEEGLDLTVSNTASRHSDDDFFEEDEDDDNEVCFFLKIDSSIFMHSSSIICG